MLHWAVRATERPSGLCLLHYETRGTNSELSRLLSMRVIACLKHPSGFVIQRAGNLTEEKPRVQRDLRYGILLCIICWKYNLRTMSIYTSLSANTRSKIFQTQHMSGLTSLRRDIYVTKLGPVGSTSASQWGVTGFRFTLGDRIY
jgi:hypothetical protein